MLGFRASFACGTVGLNASGLKINNKKLYSWKTNTGEMDVKYKYNTNTNETVTLTKVRNVQC